MKGMTEEEIADFRQKWAKTHADKLVARRTQTTAWGRVDKTKGRYRPFGRLVIDWGGWTCKEAVKGALTAAAKCSALGAPWIRKHPQSEMLEFLVLETEFEETFTNSWAMFKDEVLTQAPAVAKACGQVESQDAGQASKAIGSNARVAVPKVAPKAKAGKPTTPGKHSKNCANSRLEVGLIAKDANKVRRDYQNASSQYLDIKSNMEDLNAHGDWAWAPGSLLQQKLKLTWQSLGEDLNDWGKEYIISDDMAAMRKKYTDARILEELRRFMGMKDNIQEILALAASMRTVSMEMKSGK
jgi:hypothetical protein